MYQCPECETKFSNAEAEAIDFKCETCYNANAEDRRFSLKEVKHSE